MASKVVLITGASRGIGLACNRWLAGRGYTVFGTSRYPDQHPDSLFPLLELDVTDDESVRACVEHIIRIQGRIDVLVNNAGISLSGAIEEASPENIRQILETNLIGVHRMVTAVLPHMRKQGGGLIINMSSLAGLVGVPYLGIYATSKHALEGYTESLRYEVRDFGVKVVLIEPGDIHTSIAGMPPANPISAYDGVRERAENIHHANVQNGPPPEKVARVLGKIIESRNPRLRYTVTHGSETLLPIARRLLPHWIIERFIRDEYKL